MGVSAPYNRGRFCVGTGLIQLDKDPIAVLLVSAGYVFNPAHKFVSSITAELSGSGYARQALTGVSVVQDDTFNVVHFNASNVIWPGANFGTADAAIIYKDAVSDAQRSLLCSLDLNPKVPTSGGTFTLLVNALGILLLQ